MFLHKLKLLINKKIRLLIQKYRTARITIIGVLSAVMVLTIPAELLLRMPNRAIILSVGCEMVVFIGVLFLFVNVYEEICIQMEQTRKNISKNDYDQKDIEKLIAKGDVLAVEAAFDKTRDLIGIIEKIESNQPFKETLEFIYNSFSAYIPYTHIGVALIDPGRGTIRASYAVTGSQHPGLAKKLLGYRADIEITSLGQVLKTGQPRVINNLETYLSGREVHRYNRILLEEGVRSSITFPLMNNQRAVGIIFFSSDKTDVYREEHIQFLKVLANSIMLSLEKNIIKDDLIVSSTLALATMTEERDSQTGEHLTRMKNYSRLITELISEEPEYSGSVDYDYIREIERFSPLHDIGKVAIRDNILLKPGRLTPEEFEIMKTHTTFGGRVLRFAEAKLQQEGYSVFKTGIEITEGHHEKWDGSGYPYGKAGEDIPLSARIVAVADVLDALASKRVYKNAMSLDNSFDILYAGSGKHFDPNIIRIIKENRDAVEKEYRKFKI